MTGTQKKKWKEFEKKIKSIRRSINKKRAKKSKNEAKIVNLCR